MENKHPIKVWYEAYRHIAELLSDFYKKNQTTSARNMMALLLKTEYGDQNEWLRNSKTKYNATGVDPIQLIASFNNSNSKPETRIERMKLLIDALGSKQQVELSNDFFLGCPTPIIAQVINSRKDIYQDQIWAIFNSVVTSGRRGLIKENFNLFADWYGIDLASFTIFIFWIDSESFLPLDSNTITYLIGVGIVERSPRNYDDYMKLCNLTHQPRIYREIVRAAYEVVNLKKTNVLISHQTNNFIELNTKDETLKSEKVREEKLESILHGFKLIAIKPTKKKQEHIKNLKLDYYKFYDSYKFIDNKDEQIKYTANISDTMYSTNNKSVSISAVVGKNGSGKSTITEFLFLAINQLSLNKNLNKKLVDEKVYVDIYFFSNTLYKLSLGDRIILKKYNYDGESKIYTISQKNVINKFDLTQFFYTVAINYSLYGLNSKIIGKWIDPLFHKNDSYQMPIVLNPKRDEGTIHVNTEEGLAKSRLLAFILNWDGLIHDNDLIEVPELVESKIPLELSMELDVNKLENNRKQYDEFSKTENWEVVINDFFDLLEWHDIKAQYYVNEVKEYIYYKLISISETYDIYDKYVDVDPDELVIHFKDLIGYAEDLMDDTSHITFKLRQALNYLKYNHIHFNAKKIAKENIAKLAEKINDIQKKEFEDNKQKLETIELIPPSIFKPDIIFKGNSRFEALSSGEKQIIFAINTVAYHIYNISSVSYSETLTKYNYINIVFDEVELYFHPDMQRTFLDKLLHYLKQIPLNDILGFNFLFVTHSPFILSDIPSQNILRLEKGGIRSFSDFGETFGANIHDLLHHEFFLDQGFMGEFAKKRIVSVVDFLNSKIEEESEEESEYDWTKESVFDFIEIIGEPMIKNSLKDLYFSVYGKEEIKKEIDRLKLLMKE